VIDTASNTVVTTVPVGRRSSIEVAVTPDGKHAYITSNDLLRDGVVSVIDTATNTVVATVPVGNIPAGVGIVPPPADSIPSQRGSRSKPAPHHHHHVRLLQEAPGRVFH
jgi:YVTN family beta-propeller protein